MVSIDKWPHRPCQHCGKSADEIRQIPTMHIVLACKNCLESWRTK